MQGGRASVARGLWAGWWCGGGGWGGVEAWGPSGCPAVTPSFSVKLRGLTERSRWPGSAAVAPFRRSAHPVFFRRRAQDPRLLFMSQCLCRPAGQTQPSKQAFRFDCRPGLKAQINYQSRRESRVSVSAGVKAQRACHILVSLNSPHWPLRQTSYMFMI